MNGILGILGGTFDPVHYGHLRAAEAVRTALALPSVVLVPAGDPQHRAPAHASGPQRLQMLRLALAEFPHLGIDDREIRRAGASYTVPTLESMRAEAPARRLALILGTDAFAGLPLWHRWRELFDLSHIVVVTRPGFDPVFDAEPLASEWKHRRTARPADLETLPAGAIYLLPIPPQPVSSTEVRQALARGGIHEPRLAGMVPAPVLSYIDHNALYRLPDAS